MSVGDVRMTRIYVACSVEPVEGLCPVCFLPAMIRVTTKQLMETGVKVREHLRCRDCVKAGTDG